MFRHLFGRSEFPTKAKAQRSRRRAKHGRRLNLESLENRVLLASDSFAGATDLGSGTAAHATGTNDGFTGEFGEPTQSGQINSAWWKWRAPLNGEVTPPLTSRCARSP